jgi:hypothetical protein
MDGEGGQEHHYRALEGDVPGGIRDRLAAVTTSQWPTGRVSRLCIALQQTRTDAVRARLEAGRQLTPKIASGTGTEEVIALFDQPRDVAAIRVCSFRPAPAPLSGRGFGPGRQRSDRRHAPRWPDPRRSVWAGPNGSLFPSTDLASVQGSGARLTLWPRRETAADRLGSPCGPTKARSARSQRPTASRA